MKKAEGPTKKERTLQVAARVDPVLRKQMRLALLHRGTDFTKWLEAAMQQYVADARERQEHERAHA